MMESSGKNAEHSQPTGHTPGNALERQHSAGGGSGEITVPATDAELPDPYYGDVPDGSASTVLQPYERPGADSDTVPDYANYLPEPSRPAEQRARVTERPSQDKPEIVSCYILVDGVKKHIRKIQVSGFQTEADQVEAMRTYMEQLRNQGRYPNELDMSEQERALLSRYTGAQRRVAERLGVADNVEYDITHTPYHVLPDKKAVDTAVTREMSHTWVTPTGGTYTPITGVLWPRYVDVEKAAQHALTSPQHPQLGRRPGRDMAQRRGGELPVPITGAGAPPVDIARAHRGFARLVAESSSTFIGFPHNIRGGIPRGGELGVIWGIGYKRPDLSGPLEYDGLHRAVTEMAMTHVLREANYTGPIKWQNTGINTILDGVVRGVAERRNRHPQEIANELLAGYYNGDLAPLRYVLDTLPPGATR
jgi:hypothetical protein